MKILFVNGDGDYSALQFEDTFRGTSVQEIIDNPEKFEYNEDVYEEMNIGK